MTLVSQDDISTCQLYTIYDELEKELKGKSVPLTKEERNLEIMNLIHEFNDVKDAAQTVIGALANMEKTTIKDIHVRYNLPLSDH